MLLRTMIFLSALLILSSAAAAWQGTVVSIPDARSLNIELEGETKTVFLYGIGVPEPGEPYGAEAVSFVSSLALDKEVEVAVHRKLSGRILAEVFPPEAGQSLNALLLENGLAWVHQAYCEKAVLCGRWADIEGGARSAGQGIWSVVPENMPAWRWLKEQDSVR